jgi:hypothetical protein
MSEIEQLVDVQLAAYRARDLDAFLRCYAENVAIRDFAGNVVMDGIEGMRAQYGPLFADSRQGVTPDLPGGGAELPRSEPSCRAGRSGRTAP